MCFDSSSLLSSAWVSQAAAEARVLWVKQVKAGMLVMHEGGVAEVVYHGFEKAQVDLRHLPDNTVRRAITVDALSKPSAETVREVQAAEQARVVRDSACMHAFHGALITAAHSSSDRACTIRR